MPLPRVAPMASRGVVIEMLDVFLTDPHVIVRIGLAALIEPHPHMRIVGQAADAESTLVGVVERRPDVLVLELALPDAPGIGLLDRLRARRPRLGLVLLTTYPEDALALALVRRPAVAYLHKSRPGQAVISAIERVGAGRRYLTDTLAELAVDPSQRHECLPHARLSAREHEALLLLVDGRRVADVARVMQVTPSTASTFMANIKVKLAVDSVAGIVRYAHRAGLLR